MRDNANRVIDYLRVSVTDRCNLRCTYCQPPEGVRLFSKSEILTFEEITRLCRVFATLGVTKVKLTGGEPLARVGLVELAAAIKAIPGIKQLTLTTNGLLLQEYLPRLAAAGLDGVNISLDAATPETYAAITGHDSFHKVTDALAACVAYGIPIKINCVPLAGVNDGELPALAALARENDIAVRFIELMPIGTAVKHRPVPTKQIMTMLTESFGELTPCNENHGNGPARYYTVRGFAGRIGFISPVSGCFCAGCNRVRLTSDGRLRLCLLQEVLIDIKKSLRGGADDRDLAELITSALAFKPRGHSLGGEHMPGGVMTQIGG